MSADETTTAQEHDETGAPNDSVLWEDEGREALDPGETLVIDVEGFEGPLDLLLMLARTQKVDLARISVLALAENICNSSPRHARSGSKSPPTISSWRRGWRS